MFPLAKIKAKVAPLPGVAEEAGESTPVYLLPGGFHYANNNILNQYNFGFRADPKISLAAAARRQATLNAYTKNPVQKAAVQAVAARGGPPARMNFAVNAMAPRPTLRINNNMGAAAAGGGGGGGLYRALLGTAAGGGGGGGGGLYNTLLGTAAGGGGGGLTPEENRRQAAAVIEAAAAAGGAGAAAAGGAGAAAEANGNGFENVPLGGGARRRRSRRKTQRRRRISRRR